MKNIQDSPFLYFNFADNNGLVQPLQFNNPIKVLIATSIDEVVPCLTKVQQEVGTGYYAAGYLSYEAAPAFDPNLKVNSNTAFPLLWFGIFREPIKEELHYDYPFQQNNWQPSEPQKKYNESIQRIHDYITQGITKQVNYTTRFTTPFPGDSLGLYKQLEQAQDANYTAYLDIGDKTILSASPELFFHLKDQSITLKPMKGTIERGKTFAEDLTKKEWLRSSDKNKIENELIVELMKKDLHNIAIPNTIKTPNKFQVEKYPTVFQMTSTLTANLKSNIDMIDIFKALFPCGSITGFPRDKTMEIIQKLETEPREVYCGAIGYITPQQEAIFNVPIRTVLIDNTENQATYGVGGGITIHSDKEEEYEEVLTKLKVLQEERSSFQLLESLGLINGEYIVLSEHMKRLSESAQYFNFEVKIQEIKQKLTTIANHYKHGQWKVRLLVDDKGRIETDIEELNNFCPSAVVALATSPINKENIFLYHKTTNRALYELYRKGLSDVFDTLLWNDAGEVTEFTTGNIVIEIEEEFYTPPVESGLLAGTYRAALLENGMISERKILVEELNHATQLYYINSVRKWIPVQLKLH